MLVNALNMPIYILHGGDDDNVPPIHGRNFAEWLRELGYRLTYKEVPGRPHWWSYEDGLSCVDDTDLMGFLKNQRRDPARATSGSAPPTSVSPAGATGQQSTECGSSAATLTSKPGQRTR